MVLYGAVLRLSKLTDYAILLLTELAGRPDVCPAGELATRTRLEPPTVAKILKRLGKSGLVVSFRGASGGYRLAREPEAITIASIIAAMEGPIGMTECSVSPGACAQEAYCTVQNNWRLISRTIEQALAKVSLADMAGSPSARVRFPALNVVTLGAGS